MDESTPFLTSKGSVRKYFQDITPVKNSSNKCLKKNVDRKNPNSDRGRPVRQCVQDKRRKSETDILCKKKVEFTENFSYAMEKLNVIKLKRKKTTLSENGSSLSVTKKLKESECSKNFVTHDSDDEILNGVDVSGISSKILTESCKDNSEKDLLNDCMDDMFTDAKVLIDDNYTHKTVVNSELWNCCQKSTSIKVDSQDMFSETLIFNSDTEKTVVTKKLSNKLGSDDLFSEPLIECGVMNISNFGTDRLFEEEKYVNTALVANNIESDNSFLGLSNLFKESDEFPNEAVNVNVNQNNPVESCPNNPMKVINKCSERTESEIILINSKDSQFIVLGPFFGLPAKVKTLLQKYNGITKLYDWQEECLNLPAIQEKKNLIYALPTSGGKTLVAEILMYRELLCYKKSVLLVLPFVSIVQEKVRTLAPFALELGFVVEEYAAGKGNIPPRKRRRKRSIMIATIEKAVAVVQSLVDADRLSEIGLVVVDELHLISEGSGRGAALESMLTFLMFLGVSNNIHIVGMSATIGNLNDLARFLNAETYTGQFRPVELTEYVKCGDNVYKIDWREDETLVPFRTVTSKESDPDGITRLVMEVCPNESVLIFCHVKSNCESIATIICKNVPSDFLRHREREKKALIDTLITEFNGQVCPILQQTLKYGVAYHHSGLTPDERKLIEEAYRDGVICCICCTSTLAAGVNLPAKRVILRAPFVGRSFMNLSTYKQMVGRAGRAGLGSYGESFLICQNSDADKVRQLLKSNMDRSLSTLNLKLCCDLVLSAVSLRVAVTRATIRSFLSHTLLYIQAEELKVNIKKRTDECIHALVKLGAIKRKDSETTSNCDESKLDVSMLKGRLECRISDSVELSVSRIAKAAMRGCIPLATALKIYGDLMKAECSLVLQCSLHLLYLVTPYDFAEDIKPNYQIFFDVYMQLGPKEQHAATVIGISENHVSRMAIGHKPKDVPKELFHRFYVTLILNVLSKQQSIWEVASIFQVSRGHVQTLMSATTSFSWKVLRFCEELEELWSIKAILGEFTPRLAYCCETELLPLMELPSIKRARARQLFNAGYKTIPQIAKASARDLVAAVELLPHRAANQIIAAAKINLLERIENLKEDTEDILQDIKKEDLLNMCLM